MSFKSGYFCGFCQKKGCLSDNLQYCERCEIAIYCADSKKCKDQDWENHKSICGKVTYLQSLIPRIERNFYDFNLRSVPDEGISSSQMAQIEKMMEAMALAQGMPESKNPCKEGRQNIFETRVGDWGQMNDRHMSKPGHNNPKTMWPRDYLVRRIRLAEYQIEIAFKHKNCQIFARVLKDLLSQIRLDFNDFCMAVPMAGFMFLYLGRYKDAYDFIKFWILQADDQAECGAWEKWYPIEEGNYLRKKHSDRFENVFAITNLKGYNIKTLLVLVGIKMKIVLDFKNYRSLLAFEEELRKSKSKIGKRFFAKENKNVLNIIRELVIGKGDLKERDAARFVREQESQLKQLLREIERQNPTMIPALVNPEPLLAKECPVIIVPGGPSHVREILNYSWKYFEMLPGARAVLQDFLGTKNPKYSTRFKETERQNDTTGYDRYYQNNFSGFKMLKPEEFKKDSN